MTAAGVAAAGMIDQPDLGVQAQHIRLGAAARNDLPFERSGHAVAVVLIGDRALRASRR